MENKLQLERIPKIETYNLTARVSKAEERNELYPILLLAEDEGRVSAESVSEHLLGGRDAVARRLIAICRNLNLLAANGNHLYQLTDKGSEAVQSKKIFVPESGTWTVWVSQDPLFENPILHVEPWNEPLAVEEVFSSGDKKDRELKKVPSWIIDATEREMQSIAGNRRFFILDEILGQKCEVVDSTKARLKFSVEIDEDGVSVRCEGKMDALKVQSRFKRNDTDFPAAWEILLDDIGLWERWDEKQQALTRTFNETRDSERMSMAMNLEIPFPALPTLGHFEHIEIPGVPISAISAEDAQNWGLWRLEHLVRQYAHKALYTDWIRQAKIPFHEFDIVLPDRSELIGVLELENGSQDEKNMWFLRAMEDWNL